MEIVTVDAKVSSKVEKESSHIPPSASSVMVPEAIAKLASNLPRKEAYNGKLKFTIGPILNGAELLAFILKLPLPLPTNLKLVPLPNGWTADVYHL
jgi:hypothetical protein